MIPVLLNLHKKYEHKYVSMGINLYGPFCKLCVDSF